MSIFRSRFRSSAALGVITALLGMSLMAAPPALADTSPADPALPETVSADALPTVQIDGVVWKQLIVGNTVYVAGNFKNARPAGAAPGTQLTPRANMLAYDIRTGALIASFAPTFNAQVKDIALSADGRRLFAVGNFTSVNGVARYRFAALDLPNGTLSSSFTNGGDTYITSVEATATTIYLGGAFTKLGTQTRQKVGAVSATNGAVLPFDAALNVVSGETQVNDIVVAPDGKSIVIAGNFTSVAGSSDPGYGLARLDATTAASLPLPVNTVARNAGPKAAMMSLESDGQYFYGSGYHFGGGGNVEGTWAARWDTGELVWIEDCHGDTYAAYPIGDVVYQASHKHYCANSGGFPQTEPWSFYHSTAVTKQPRGQNTADVYNYPDHPGRPRPEILEWYPQWTIGTFTGKSQGPWTVTGNSDYVLYGGEFLRVNNGPQEGLARFARKALAPNAQGPLQKGSNFRLTARSLGSGEVRLSWPGNPDRDNATLTYSLYRGSTTSAPIHARTVTAPFWNQPAMNFTDTGLVPGSTQRYRVIARDSFGNEAMSDWITLTVSDVTATSYAKSVLDSAARYYWRLGEPSGTTVDDWASDFAATASTGVTRGAAGAISGDSDRASTFSGTSTGYAATAPTAPIAGPSVFAVEAWFKTTTTTGGKIVGFGNSLKSTASSKFDRHIYMANDGRIVFGTFNGSHRYLNTTTRYNDGKWHHVVGSLGQEGLQLFVDGARVGALSGVTAPDAYYGAWRIGGDNLNGWPLQPSSRYFAGQVDEVAVYDSPLSAAQVAQHHAIGTGATAPNAPPTARFTDSVNGLTVAVDGSTSSDSDGRVASHAWNFGDGRTTTGATATHSYAAAGTYTVTLTVTDDRGASATSSRSVTVSQANQAPTARFTASTTALQVAVDGSASADPDGTIADYAWSFGDGGTAKGATASHTYAAAGTYRVTLTVTDAQGARGETTQDVTVAAAANAAPTASFTSSVDGLTAAVDASASNDPDGTIARYEWSFGDGAKATGRTASRTYATAGTYTVTLTVTDDGGQTATTSQPVTVTSATQPMLFASDAFSRAVSSGWGAADQGGTWTVSGGTTNFTVGGGVGMMRVATSASPKAQLASVAQRDVDAQATFSLNQIGTGGGTFVSLAARGSGWNNDYRAKVWVKSTGAVVLHLTRTDGPETTLQALALSGMSLTPGEALAVRLQVTGAAPTALRAKAWKAGEPEPTTWNLSTTDPTSNLQDAGAVGLVGYLSATSTVTPVAVSVDNLSVGPVQP